MCFIIIIIITIYRVLQKINDRANEQNMSTGRHHGYNNFSYLVGTVIPLYIDIR